MVGVVVCPLQRQPSAALAVLKGPHRELSTSLVVGNQCLIWEQGVMRIPYYDVPLVTFSRDYVPN